MNMNGRIIVTVQHGAICVDACYNGERSHRYRGIFAYSPDGQYALMQMVRAIQARCAERMEVNYSSTVDFCREYGIDDDGATLKGWLNDAVDTALIGQGDRV